jgi:hypothetical protein
MCVHGKYFGESKKQEKVMAAILSFVIG